MTPMRAEPAEIPLHGGFTNAGLVMRVGDTVRRPLRSASPATHALLRHLEHVGFDGAPRFLGIDERGREVLSYIPGQAVVPPYPPWALTDEALVSVAELLRRFHDAAASFDAGRHVWERAIPAQFSKGLISHNDPNLDNVIFARGRAVALIDFDLACPGSAVWDLACAARLWVPLRDDADTPDEVRGRSLARLRMFVDAYGLPAAERAEVVDAMLHAYDWCYDIVRAAVTEGHETFDKVWHGGGWLRSERTRRWIATHGGAMRDALRPGP